MADPWEEVTLRAVARASLVEEGFCGYGQMCVARCVLLVNVLMNDVVNEAPLSRMDACYGHGSPAPVSKD